MISSVSSEPLSRLADHTEGHISQLDDWMVMPARLFTRFLEQNFLFNAIASKTTVPNRPKIVLELTAMLLQFVRQTLRDPLRAIASSCASTFRLHPM